MGRENDSKSIYDNLAMQAALRLYLPRSESGSGIPLPESVSLDRPAAEPFSLRLASFKEIFKKRKEK